MDNRSIQQTLARIHGDRPIATLDPEGDLAPEVVKWLRRNKAIMDIALPAVMVAFALGVVVGYFSRGPLSQAAPIQRIPPIVGTNGDFDYLQARHKQLMADFHARFEKIMAGASDLREERIKDLFWKLDRKEFEEEWDKQIEEEVERRIARSKGTPKGK